MSHPLWGLIPAAPDRRSLNPHNLSGLNDSQSGKRGRYDRLQILQAVSGSAENQHSNVPTGHTLLIWDAPIDCYEDIESSGFSGFEQISVLQSRQIGKAGCLAVIAWELKPKALVNALVDHEPHQARASSNSLASSSASTARARETVGNPSRKSSSVSPPSK